MGVAEGGSGVEPQVDEQLRLAPEVLGLVRELVAEHEHDGAA